MTAVTIVDYGVGNMYSVKGALAFCGAEVIMGDTPGILEDAERLLLPGVGAFSDSMDDMREHDLIETIRNHVNKGKPLLGICLGMQMLLDRSEEFGTHDGLGLIAGTVNAIPPEGTDGTAHCIPHMGWNELRPADGCGWNCALMKGVPEETSMYFAHSFRAQPDDPAHRSADCDYDGHGIAAVIHRGNVFGCQFHPEKSGEIGLAIIRNFLAL